MQPFSSIIHNVRSNHEYDEQIIQPINPAVLAADFSLQLARFSLATHTNLQILESMIQSNSVISKLKLFFLKNKIYFSNKYLHL
jgi:hypothetical protein